VIFQTARDALDALVPLSNLKSNGDTKAPVRVTFEGAAFYDGWHGGDPPVGHGRCNSTVGATSELHPVFRVLAQ